MGGAEVYAYNFSKHLLNKNYNITIYTNEMSKNLNSELNLEHPNFTLIRSKWIKWLNIPKLLINAAKIYRLIKKKRRYILHLHLSVNHLSVIGIDICQKAFICIGTRAGNNYR